jgi:hypothetical protein
MYQNYQTEVSMTKHNILFIGLDTHKTFIEVAYIEGQRGARSIHLGKILSNKDAFKNSRDNYNQNTLTLSFILFTKLALVAIVVIGFNVY